MLFFLWQESQKFHIKRPMECDLIFLPRILWLILFVAWTKHLLLFAFSGVFFSHSQWLRLWYSVPIGQEDHSLLPYPITLVDHYLFPGPRDPVDFVSFLFPRDLEVSRAFHRLLVWTFHSLHVVFHGAPTVPGAQSHLRRFRPILWLVCDCHQQTLGLFDELYEYPRTVTSGGSLVTGLLLYLLILEFLICYHHLHYPWRIQIILLFLLWLTAHQLHHFLFFLGAEQEMELLEPPSTGVLFELQAFWIKKQQISGLDHLRRAWWRLKNTPFYRARILLAFIYVYE